MPQVNHKNWTYSEYLDLDDDKRYEIYEGELLEMSPSPNLFHQDLILRLAFIMDEYFYNKDSGKLYVSPCDVILSHDNIVQPDIVYIKKENFSIISDKKAVRGIPDLVVEVLSPSNKDYDRKDKFKIYEKFNIKEYWIVDPEGYCIEVYSIENSKYKLLGKFKNHEEIKTIVLEGFKVSFEKIVERIRF